MQDRHICNLTCWCYLQQRVLERNCRSCTLVRGQRDGFLGGTVTVANWRADDTQPAIREVISVSRGSRSSEIAWRTGEGRNQMQEG